jgi:tetratricopeptide (TPR) repeat protein
MEFSIESHVMSAAAAYRAGKFSEASAAYSTVTQLDPKNASAREHLGAISLWNNHPDEAIGHLKEALRLTTGLQKLWPLNAQLNVRLAMAHYRADRFPQASTFFKQAAGPIALGPFRQLEALANWLAIFDAELPYAIGGPAETRIELVVIDPLPVVKVSVADGAPAHFLIDTGGSEVILDTHHP